MRRTAEETKDLAPHHVWLKISKLTIPRDCVVVGECVMSTMHPVGDKVQWFYSGPLPEYLKELSEQEVADIEADDPAVDARETGEIFPEGSPQSSAIAMRDQSVRAALEMLDHQNDDHWSQGRLPKVKVVNGFLKSAEHKLTTLAEIRVIAPDFIRDTDAAADAERVAHGESEEDIFGEE